MRRRNFEIVSLSIVVYQGRASPGFAFATVLMVGTK